MHMLSPRGLLYALHAFVERPVRHRRHDETTRPYSRPEGVWWADDDRWFPADFPPRTGNRLVPLVDGEEAMRVMYEVMENAHRSIYLAAWFVTPELRMIRSSGDLEDPRAGGGGPYALLSLLSRKADDVDVRILLWPGSIWGKFSRRHVKAVHRTLARAHPRIRARLDSFAHASHCQHQKALVVDGEIAFVGGLDVTAFDADRWDLATHALRPSANWHDTHWRIEGPCVADVAANFAQRWNAVAPRDPVPAAAMPRPIAHGVAAQVLRTVPKRTYPFAPDGVYGIAYAYLHAIERAERFIYLENQYLWSPEVTEALCAAIRRGHGSGLRVALVLPSHPNIGKGDTDRHITRLLSADDGRGAFRAYTLYTSGWDAQQQCYQYRPVYVHAKVAIIDDAWATAGSANLNGRGMATDTEINVATTDPTTIKALRVQLWSEHLGCAPDELRDADPVAVLSERLAASADEQQRIVTERSGPLTAALYPYQLGYVDADFGPGEIESLLLDR